MPTCCGGGKREKLQLCAPSPHRPGFKTTPPASKPQAALWQKHHVLQYTRRGLSQEDPGRISLENGGDNSTGGLQLSQKPGLELLDQAVTH